MEELFETSVSVLTDLVKEYSSNEIIKYSPLAQSGSRRRYFRFILEDGNSIIGAYNEDIAENIAFFTYSDFFLSKNLNVPTILKIHNDKKHYLINDLGKETLYDIICNTKKENSDFQRVIRYYEKVVAALPKFQLTNREGLDLSVAYPRAAFDRQSMQWDLNYFKYYYLKMVNIQFNEQLLEDDYQAFMDYLLSVDSNYFLYRDFQSRNIMVQGDDVYFIDYQGGRKGALQYDIASLLYDAKADLSPDIRNYLLNKYLDELEKHILVDREKFKSYVNAFSLIRIMQAMGAYGYRGYFERKAHFLQSIPYAINNLKYLLKNNSLPDNLKELNKVLRDVVEHYKPITISNSDNLTLDICSFSYKKGIPEDYSGNGGGFVFDCRALPNPGREKEYQTFTGLDACVKEYLRKYDEVQNFEKHIFAIVDMSIDNYLERKFTHLSINFGCTGGQHRSVFLAESTATHIRKKYPQVIINLKHTNLQ